MRPEQREEAIREVREGLAGGYTEISERFSLELSDDADEPFSNPQTLSAQQTSEAMDRAQCQAMLSVVNAETDSSAYDDACMYASVLIEAGAIRGSDRAPKWLMDFVRGVLNGRIQRPSTKDRTSNDERNLAVYLVIRGLQSRYGIPVYSEASSSADSAITIVAEAMNETPEAVEDIYTRFRDRLEGKGTARRK